MGTIAVGERNKMLDALTGRTTSDSPRRLLKALIYLDEHGKGVDA